MTPAEAELWASRWIARWGPSDPTSQAFAALLADIVLRAETRATGGPPPPVDTSWGNRALGAPPSAADESMPALDSERSSRRVFGHG